MRSRNSVALGLMLGLACAFPMTGQTRTVLVPPSARKKSTPTTIQASPPVVGASVPAHSGNTAILPAGYPLRVQLDRRYRMRQGVPVIGKLLDPVYAGDDIVLPANTILYGTISRLQPIQKSTRTWALLDGDVTPLKQPVLIFDSLLLPSGQRIQLTANATERTAGIVKMGTAHRKQSLVGRAKAQVDAKEQSVLGVVHSRHKSDMALQFVYGQLPYHPQDIWAGTQYDATLTQPVTVPDQKPKVELPLTPPQGHIPPGTLDARLVTGISSATNKPGNPVLAVLTRPYLNPQKTAVVLPTGTKLIGVITEAKPARSFDRNGTLRFSFRQVELPTGTLESMHGQMTAVEGQKGQNVTVDSEGGAKANSAQGKFLAPLLLGAMASHSFDSDQGAAEAGAYSNGFGLVARIVGFVAVTPAVSVGFGFYSFGKSATRRWLMRGHDVVFPKDTRLELAVADR